MSAAAGKTASAKSLRFSVAMEEEGQAASMQGKATETAIKIDWSVPGKKDPTFVLTGGKRYNLRPDGTAINEYPADQFGGSYSEASKNVIGAFLKSDDVAQVGSEKVRGAESTHYRITLGKKSWAALLAIPSEQRGYFFLDTDDAKRLSATKEVDVWIADGLIRQVALKFEDADPGVLGAVKAQYYDYNAPIVIKTPKVSKPAK